MSISRTLLVGAAGVAGIVVIFVLGMHRPTDTGSVAVITQESVPAVTQAQGTLVGTVTLSPVCPVEHDPPEPGCMPKGYATRVTIQRIGSTSPAMSTQADAAGRFSLGLPAGDYEIGAQGGAVYPRCSPVTVHVGTGTTTVAVSCDSGIR